MLTPELESRMSKIIEKLDKLQISDKKESEDDFLSEQEKYEYLIQKNAQKRVSQNFEKISDFFNRENEEETEEDDADEFSQENESSMALNMKKLITIGEFQISLDKLLELLEESLNIKENNDEKYLDKYVNDISLITDDDTVSMDDDTKKKEFAKALVKKYHKIAHLLKRYIGENNIVNELLSKEKKKGGKKKSIQGNKRRSLFDNALLISEKKYKPIKGFPNLGNTFMSEVLANIEKKKRSSCVNIGNVGKKEEPLSCDKSSDEEEEEEEEIEENGEKIPAYRPGKLRSSFMFN